MKTAASEGAGSYIIYTRVDNPVFRIVASTSATNDLDFTFAARVHTPRAVHAGPVLVGGAGPMDPGAAHGDGVPVRDPALGRRGPSRRRRARRPRRGRPHRIRPDRVPRDERARPRHP